MPNDNLGFNALGQGSLPQRHASYHGAGALPATRSPEPRPTCAGVRKPLWQRRPVRRGASSAALGVGNSPSWTNAIVASWCGMRGIVTLVTALALPATFPHRDLILFAAFSVTFRTLTIQGQTLRPLMLRLRLASDDVVEREVQSARIELADVARHALEAHTGSEAEALRSQLQTQRAAAGDAAEGRAAALRIQSLRRLTLDRRRARLLELRRTGVIGDDAFHRLEEELDLADLDRSG